MRRARTSQNGSAFFIILIAIAMFAMLSYAVSQGSRSSASSLNAEQTIIAAQEILSYANTVAKAVQRMRLAGCKDTEISADSSAMPQVNAAAPADESCHIASLKGGKVNMQYRVPPAYHVDASDPDSGAWLITASDDITGVGTNGCSDETCADLTLTVFDVKPEICAAMNKLLGIDTMPADTDYDRSILWVGAYDSSPNEVGNTVAGVPMRGKTAACLNETGSNSYIFYQILIAR